MVSLLLLLVVVLTHQFETTLGCLIVNVTPKHIPKDTGFLEITVSSTHQNITQVLLYNSTHSVETNFVQQQQQDDKVVVVATDSVLRENSFYHVDVIGCARFDHDSIYVHDGTYDLVKPVQEQTYYNVAGKTNLVLNGTNLFASNDLKIKFYQPKHDIVQFVYGGEVLREDQVKVVIPPIITPPDWYIGCPDPSEPVRGGACVPDLQVEISLSLDGGLTYGNTVWNTTFRYEKPIKVAFILLNTIDDLGWSTRINQGRMELEEKYGRLIDASLYFENIPEGEFEGLQTNKGETLATNTEVPEFIMDPITGKNKTNTYFPAFDIMKQLCDQDVDLVVAGSFGYQKQAFDVSNSYQGCWENGHLTYFLSLAGNLVNQQLSTGFAKIYQMRYLSGLIAGYQLRKLHRLQGKQLCVGYLAAYPIPEVLRGINAFTIGCNEIFQDCKVHVMFTGTWHHPQLERDAAAFLFHQEKCIIITQHSDTIEPQRYYARMGGYGLAYHGDQRQRIGDSVLQSAMLNWGPVFSHFLDQVIHKKWQPHQQAWLGVDQDAVKLGDYFSPQIEQYFVEIVSQKLAELKQNAIGDQAFNHIFCNSTRLRKRWVFRKHHETNIVISGCGFQPEWQRLDTTQPIHPDHFNHQTDCLLGQALLQDAFTPPNNGDPKYIFNDFLLDGVELLQPRTTQHGTIHDTDNHACFSQYGTLGDRFYTALTDYGKCDATQWEIKRSQTCDPQTMSTEIHYQWINNSSYCGDELDVLGKYSKIADLPILSPGIPCDYVPFASDTANIVILIVILGVVINILFVFLLIKFRKNKMIQATQPLMVICMSIGGVLLNLSNISFLGQPTESSCLARVWTFNLAFDFVFTFLWAKIHRVNLIYRQFTSRSNPASKSASIKRKRKRHQRKNKSITDASMLKVVASLLMVEVFILTTWTLSDPPRPIPTREIQVKLPRPALGSIMYIECSQDTPVFMVATMMLKVFLVLSSCYLVFVTKDVPNNFVEHKFIIFSAYNTAILSGMILLLTFSHVEGDPATPLIIQAIGISIGTIIVNGSLVIPRVALLLGYLEIPKGDANPHSQLTTTTVNQSQTNIKRPASANLLSSLKQNQIVPASSPLSDNHRHGTQLGGSSLYV